MESAHFGSARFCRLAAEHGRVLTAHQIASPRGSASAWGGPITDGSVSRYLLPDVTVWSAPGEHHEIKHKNQTRDGCYGLELYRLEALVRWANTTGQSVYNTIHDWEHAGATDKWVDTPNRIEDWLCADVAVISKRSTKGGYEWSWRNGIWSWEEMRYWSAHIYFRPLAEIWSPSQARLETELRAADPSPKVDDWPPPVPQPKTA